VKAHLIFPQITVSANVVRYRDLPQAGDRDLESQLVPRYWPPEKLPDLRFREATVPMELLVRFGVEDLAFYRELFLEGTEDGARR